MFGWNNIFGLVIVIIMIIPNFLYAMRFRDAENRCTNKIMNILEQIGRYASVILMFVPLGLRDFEFGFYSKMAFLVYFFCNGGLLLIYIIIWLFYFKKKSLHKALALAIIPTCIFLISGITLRHWLLVISAIIFGVGHIFITFRNNKL